MATSKGGYVSGGFDILKAPNAPTITSVATNIGSATVAFTAPTDVGGGAITSYTITAVNESTGASTGAVGSASPITISPGGGTFKIRAAATNIYGPGRVSQYETGKQIYSGARLYAWGANGAGQLGLNNKTSQSSVSQVGFLTTWLDVAGGGAQSLAVKTDNTLWAWGSNYRGRLGDNTVVDKSSPIQIGALTNWSKVAGGNQSSFALKTDGTLWAWGFNGDGRLGDGTEINRSSPVQVGALTGWTQIAPGINHTLALRSNGTLWAWGSNSYFALGSSISSPSSPVQVGALTNWYQVSAGQSFSMAVKTDGTLWGWGRNADGRLGDGTVTTRSSPVQIGALTNWAQVSCQYQGSSAVKIDGTMWGWGQNSSGQVGDGTFILRSSPVQVGALTNWKSLAQGSRREHNLAVKTDGTLWAWGAGANGELGIGSTYNRNAPVQVGVSTAWYQAAGGGGFSLGLTVVV